jgi:hypothetical protein
MPIRLLATLCLTVVFAIALARQNRTRASVSPLIFWGIVVIALSAARGARHGGEIARTLLLQRHLRGLDDLLFYDLGLMLGYAFVLGALLAIPWLTPSSAREAGSELRNALREDLFSWSSWRKFFARRMPWLLAVAVMLLLWRWIGASYR